jgi:hypothetical protein
MTKKAAKTDPVLTALLITVVIIGLLFSVQVSGLVPAQGQSMPMYGALPSKRVRVYTTPVQTQRPVWSNRAAVRRTEREMRIHHAAPAQSSSSSSKASRRR